MSISGDILEYLLNLRFRDTHVYTNRLSESPAGLQFRGVEESGHVHVLVLGRGIHIGQRTDLSARYSLIWQPTTSLKHSSDSQK